MTFMQYLSTTVYRYYIKQSLLKVIGIFEKRSAILITVDMRNPKTLSSGGMRNPKTLSNSNMRNPKTITSADMEIRTEV